MPLTNRRALCNLVPPLAAALLVACRGSSPEPPAFVLTPRIATAAAGDPGGVALEAAARGGGAVTWTLVPDGLGTLAVTGSRATYHAPSALDRARTAFVEARSGPHTLRAEIAVLPVTVWPSRAVARAGAGPVRFQAVLPVAGAVTWTLDPPDAGTLAASGAQVDYTPPASGGSREARLVADAGVSGGQAAATLTVAGTDGITVSGVVVDSDETPPVEGAVVRVGSTTTTTDASGRFTVAGVTPPYDLVVVRPGVTGANVWVGLTRADPRVYAPFSSGRWSSVNISFVSGTFPGASTDAQVRTEANARRSTYWSGQGPTGFGGPVFWAGAPTVDLTVRGLQWRARTDGAADAYLAYGSRPVTLSTMPVQDLEVPLDVPVAAWRARGSIAWDPAYAKTPDVGVVVDFLDGELRPSRGVEAVGGRFDLLVPDLATGTVTLYASVMSPATMQPPLFDGAWASVAQVVAPGAGELVMSLPAAPVIVAPAGGLETLPTFRWTAPDGGHARIDLGCVANGVANGSWVLYSAGSSVAFPDLQALGAQLQAGSSCRWSVEWSAEGLDEAAAPREVVPVLPRRTTTSSTARWGRFDVGPAAPP